MAIDIKKLVYRIVSESFKTPVESITDSSSLTELADDSIALFQLVITFERVLGHSVTYDDIASIERVGDIVAYAQRLPLDSLNAEALDEFLN